MQIQKQLRLAAASAFLLLLPLHCFSSLRAAAHSINPSSRCGRQQVTQTPAPLAPRHTSSLSTDDSRHRRPHFQPGQLRVLLDSGSSITPNITRVTAHGQAAEVRVSRPSGQAHSSDVVALYVPADKDPRSVLPVKWVNITAVSPDYPQTGQATVLFRLLNFRGQYRFRLIGNGTFSPVVFAESRPLFNAVYAKPSQVHLALHADGRAVVVQWVSGDAAPQQVQYQQPGQPAAWVTSTSRTYTAAMMCGEPAATFGFIDPGHLHTAVLPGEAVGHNRMIRYKVGSTKAGWSSSFTFTSAPEPAAVAAGQESLTFLVFNDVGQENLVVFNDVECPPYCPLGWSWSNYTGNSTKLVKHLLQESDARLALLVGDLSYANGVQADWDYFGFQFEAPFSRWPLAVAPGNHERHYPGPPLSNDTAAAIDDSGGECNVPYTYRYYSPAWEAADPPVRQTAAPAGATSSSAPQHGAASVHHRQPWYLWLSPAKFLRSAKERKQQQQQPGGPLPQRLNPHKSYYSFNMGNAHFLMLDSESPSDPGSPQRNWVSADLAQINRQAYPWVIVSLHHQMVGPTTNALNILHKARLTHDYEALFIQHKVDLVLQGHDHAYARTCPYAQGKCSNSSGVRPPGSRVEVVEDAGAPVYVLAGHAGAGFTHAFPEELPEWVRYGVQDQNGYLRVTVSGSRLTLVSVSTDDGHIMDGVQLVKTGSAAEGQAGRQ